MARDFAYLALIFLGAGCGGSTNTLPPPSYFPAESAKRAIAEFDTNKDGKLDAEELQRCPSLLRSLESMDLNKDGCLDAKEIEERLQKLESEQLSFLAVTCRVVRDGTPVEGVKVTLTPEKFHGGALKIASGTSAADGNVQFRIEGQEQDGVQAGFYRVAVSLPDASGKETLPPHLNANTNLGWELSQRVMRRRIMKIDLNQ